MKNYSKDAVWRIFSKYIRARDADWRGWCQCISCSAFKNWKEMDAGHFIPKGSDEALRFDEDNVHAQCTSCNLYKSANLIEYRWRLCGKIGESRVKALEVRHQMKHRSGFTGFSQFELNAMYLHYKKEFDRLKSQKSLE